MVSDSNGKVAISTTTDTEIGYVNGVTSAIQTQLNGKQKTIYYGSMYEDTPAGNTWSLGASANNITKWSNSTAGELSGMTHSTPNDDLTISAGSAGIYFVDANVAGLLSSNNTTYTFYIYKTTGGSPASTSLKSYCRVSNAANSTANVKISGLLSLAEGDIIDLRASAATTNASITTYHADVTLVRVG